MYSDSDEEVIEETELEEVPQETITKLEYLCTVCFDIHSAEDLNGNLDDCPTCGETECIKES